VSDKIYYLIIFLLVAYGLLIGWYLRAFFLSKKKPAEEKSSSSSKHGHSKNRKRRAGKKCPDCKKVIDVRRTVCQHCGHKFEVPPGTEPHPEEIRMKDKQGNTASPVKKGKFVEADDEFD